MVPLLCQVVEVLGSLNVFSRFQQQTHVSDPREMVQSPQEGPLVPPDPSDVIDWTGHKVGGHGYELL